MCKASQLVKELMDAAHGKPNRFSGPHAKEGVQEFHEYPYSLVLDPRLTGRVINAFNTLLPAEGIEAKSELKYSGYPDSGMPYFVTELKGERGTVHIWQMYVATLTGQPEEAPVAGKIGYFPLGLLQIATFPHIFFERTARDQPTVYVDADWEGPVKKLSSQTIHFPNYAVMAKQLLAFACGGRPKPAEVQLSLALA